MATQNLAEISSADCISATESSTNTLVDRFLLYLPHFHNCANLNVDSSSLHQSWSFRVNGILLVCDLIKRSLRCNLFATS